MDYDEDIAKLTLSDPEKTGLQVYRNYTKSFMMHREKKFAEEIDASETSIDRIKEVLALIETEHVKFVPVIACSFADEELKVMYRANLPEGIPGGRSAMLGGFGPLSNLHSRIQFSFAFDLISPDILGTLNKLRDQRNKLSHTWNARLLDDFFKDVSLVQVIGLDEAIVEAGLGKILEKPKDYGEATLRIRTAWLLTRVSYEALWYWKAKKAGLNPTSVLYGPNHPKLLGKVSIPATDLTRRLAG